MFRYNELSESTFFPCFNIESDNENVDANTDVLSLFLKSNLRLRINSMMNYKDNITILLYSITNSHIPLS